MSKYFKYIQSLNMRSKYVSKETKHTKMCWCRSEIHYVDFDKMYWIQNVSQKCRADERKKSNLIRNTCNQYSWAVMKHGYKTLIIYFWDEIYYGATMAA